MNAYCAVAIGVLVTTNAAAVFVASRALKQSIRSALDKHVLHGAVAEAREAFYRYQTMHVLKGTPEGDKKALVNEDLGDSMDRALKKTGYVELGPLQQAIVNLQRQFVRQVERQRKAAEGRQ